MSTRSKVQRGSGRGGGGGGGQYERSDTGCELVHVCMAYTERAETVAVSPGTSHVTSKQRCNHLGGYSERAV